MAAKEAAKGGQHKATYSTDKKNGGYLIRVQGPKPDAFAGREVPVERKGGVINQEKLTRLIWKGLDDGNISGYVGPVALYAFAPRPKDVTDEIPF